MLATPAYLVCALYMKGLLAMLTGEAVATTFWVGQVILLWSYVTVVTQSVSKRIYMMCGHEKRLMYLGVGEALLNLALSVGLVLYFRSVICVAVGSLLSTCVFGWCFLWPWAARQSQLSGWSLAGKVLGPAWLACLPVLALFLLERTLPFLQFGGGPVQLFSEGGVALLVAASGMWWLALTEMERSKLAALLTRRRTA
jgi:hypothetical protein